MSHSLIRTIAPSGHLHTFDFHQQRSEKAKEEFQDHGISDYVTCYHRDVCELGFEPVEGAADAVFLDLPHPWKVVGHAKKSMKKSGGRICSFSPCIEQVQQTCEALKADGFTEVNTIECLLREFQVRKITLPEFDPEFDPLEAKEANKVKDDINDETTDDRTEASNDDKEGENNRKRKLEVCREREKKFLSGLPLLSMPGHTGYLTFATLPAVLQ